MSGEQQLTRRTNYQPSDEDWVDYPIFEPPASGAWNEEHVLSSIHIVFGSLDADEYYLFGDADVDGSVRRSTKSHAVSEVLELLNQESPSGWYLREIFKWIYAAHKHLPKRLKVEREIGGELKASELGRNAQAARADRREDAEAKLRFKNEYLVLMEKKPLLTRENAINEIDFDGTKYKYEIRTLLKWAREAYKEVGRVCRRGRPRK